MQAATKANVWLYRRSNGRTGAGACTDFKDKLPSCDAYVLRAILHDWDDNSAQTILRDSRGITGGRDDSSSRRSCRISPGRIGQKLLDIQMHTMHTGRERTCAEYAKHLAEEMFRLERVVETRWDV